MNKLKDLHKTIEEYLLKKCDEPCEIYAFNNVHFDKFNPDDEIIELGSYTSNGVESFVCIAKEKKSILIFYAQNDQVLDSNKMDATPNNLALMNEIIKRNDTSFLKKLNIQFDTFSKNEKELSIEELIETSKLIYIGE